MKLLIAELWFDPSIQVRDRLDEDAVAEYAELLDHSKPPPVVVFDETKNIVADGFHRIEAAHRRGRLTVAATRLPGGREEAIAYAITANARGRAVRLTRSEQNRGIRRLLDLGWTQRRIGKEMGVGQVTVLNIDHERKLTATLPPELASAPELTPTHRYRIATLPEEDQTVVAQVVVDEALSEPETRALVKQIRNNRQSQPRTGPATSEEVLGWAKQIVARLNETDPWKAMQRLTAAAAHARNFTIDELADATRDSPVGWGAEIDDLIDRLGQIRERMAGSRLRRLS